MMKIHPWGGCNCHLATHVCCRGGCLGARRWAARGRGGGGYGLSGVVVACVAAVGRGIIDAGSGLRGGSSAAGV